MKREAILHIPMSEYGHGVSETTAVFRLRAAKGDLRQCIFHYGDRACRENPIIFTAIPMEIVASDVLFDYWEVEFDTPYRRLCYYFALYDEGEAILYYADAFHDAITPERSEFFQLPYLHRANIARPPEWAKDAVIYNIFPDSFATGHRHISQKPSESTFKGEIVRGKLGGTLKGITENADYFQALGINCVYINPFFAAGEYHKYDLLDYYTVDPCMGTNADFAKMVQVLHSTGIRVIIDGVFNHCGWRFFAFDDVVRNGENSRYRDWFYRLEYPVTRPESGEDIPGYECFAYERLMPKLDTTFPQVREYFFDVCRFWLQEYDIDGWRFDCADEVDDCFWRDMLSVARQVKPEVFIMGEVWHNANHWLDGTMFHSTMNYTFRKHCREFFAEARTDAQGFNAGITNMLLRYRKNMVSAQLNLLDSHDVSRFLSLCRGDKKRFRLAVLFQMCFVGIPSVFYGDEQGLSGIREEEYRRPMVWDGDGELYAFYRRAIALRHAHAALRRGSFKALHARGREYIFQRAYEGEKIIVALHCKYTGAGEILWEGEDFMIVKSHG
ncbi:MAG: glycoside hydrolase family 13 protein [Defluviitaleaceae bacterium]|nr:glycoside hydrolase family 13 protein [Defluviitaleaceae bacterium]MCL2238895.1 glycoside hydrolase family 13 protein [Defluviitaleaceae bacterium]